MSRKPGQALADMSIAAGNSCPLESESDKAGSIPVARRIQFARIDAFKGTERRSAPAAIILLFGHGSVDYRLSLRGRQDSSRQCRRCPQHHDPVEKTLGVRALLQVVTKELHLFLNSGTRRITARSRSDCDCSKCGAEVTGVGPLPGLIMKIQPGPGSLQLSCFELKRPHVAER